MKNSITKLQEIVIEYYLELGYKNSKSTPEILTDFANRWFRVEADGTMVQF